MLFIINNIAEKQGNQSTKGSHGIAKEVSAILGCIDFYQEKLTILFSSEVFLFVRLF